MKRKIFAAFLSLMMVISMLPTSAFATEVDVPADCQHANAHWETVKEATCTVAGVKTAHCPDCDKDVKGEIPATGHAPKEEWVVVDGSYVPADCEHAGHETYVCPNCDGQEEGGSETRDIKEDPALGHDIKKTVVNPTCKDGGYTLEECTRGDYSKKTNFTDPTGEHNMVLVSELRKADCKTGTNGIGRYACSICGESGGYRVIPAEHVKEEDKANSKAATCKDEGKIAYKCSVCGEVSEPEEVPESALGHKYVEKTEDPEYKKVTCEEDGLIVKVCATCGDRKTEVDPATGKHQWNNGVDKPATCTTPGGATYTCLKCGAEHFEEYTGTAAEPAKGHTPKVMPKVDATCSTTGLTEGSECAVCHEILVPQEKTPVDENAHTPVVAKELRPAKCGGQTGIVRLECKDCHTFLRYEVISNDHIPVEATRVEPNCGTAGKVTYKCSRCGEALPEMDEVLDATGKHTTDKNNKDYLKIVEPTCTEAGKIIPLCTVCNAEVESESEPYGTALGHDMQIDTANSKAATCEEAGVEATKCSRCDKTETKEVPALGHKWVSAGLQEADCQHAAGEKFVCENDSSHTYVKEFEGELAEPKKEHTPKVIPGVDPTCTTTGLTEGSECEVCHEILVAQVEIPVDEDAHKAVVAKELRPAVCGGQTGIARMECELCHKNLGYEVVSAEHVPVEATRVEPTCGKDGKITVEVNGVRGASCRELVRETVEKLGVELSTELKPEYFEQTEEKEQEKNRF